MQRRKIYFVAALTALMIVGFLTTSLTSYIVARESLSHSISDQMLPLISDNIYSEIQRDLLRPILISSLMSTGTFVRDWAVAGEVDEEKIRAYLHKIQQEYGTITAFFVSERTKVYYHPDGIIKTLSEQDPADAWYYHVRSLKDDFEVNVDFDTADRTRMSIFINYKVVSDQGQFLGVTGVGLSVNAVTGLIESYKARYGREIYFVDRNGNIALDRGDGYQARMLQDMSGISALSAQILTTPSASLTYEGAEGATVFVNSRFVPEFNWYLMVEQNSRSAEAAIRKTLIVNVLFACVIIAIVMVGAHFTLRLYYSRLEEMATTDQLTLAVNRHVFDGVFEQLSKSAKRRGKPISLVSIDIDHLKEVNESFGHQAGDIVLRSVADLIRAHSRESDTLCRWGVEEFLLLLDECSSVEAAEIAENIRKAVKRHPIIYGLEEVRVTISCGVTQSTSEDNLDSLITRVDAALYRAKHEGRDRINISA
jgi:diguanylate cyclase (GGDEF)-like protein